MKIAIVVPGGFERPDGRSPPRRIPALHSLVSRLALDHEVHVFCTDFDERGGTWPFLGATVHDPRRVPSRRLPLLRTTERGWRLLRLVRRASETSPFDVVHAFWIDGNGLAAAFAARWLGLPLVASLGGGECASLPEVAYGNARTASGRFTTRAVVTAARVVTAGSRHARSALPAGEVQIVPLGADRETFDGEVHRPLGPPWRVVHIANRNAVKDPWTLLSALRSLTDSGLDVHLEWFGADTLSGAVEARARALGLAARIDFRGEQPSSVVAAALLSAHVHVVSSRHESQCVAVLEAALAGTPTVSTDVGVAADLSPEAALVVPVGDARALGEGLRALLADPRRRRAIGEAARDYARGHDARWTASTFVSLYERALRARSEHPAFSWRFR